MKNIYMVQPNSQYGNSIYFPYAAGCLVAYAFKDERVKNEYTFKAFVYKKQDIDEVVSDMENPFFVGFSCYVWNYEYNKLLAKKIKEKFPSCLIAFGGHQINEKSEVIGSDYVDFVMLGEGEESFKKLLLALSDFVEIGSVPNLIYKNESQELVKSEEKCTQIPERVSAYLDGWFDDLIDKEELGFSTILETNRGCPNRCAFCDWGNIKSRVHNYDLDMIKKELDWMAEKKIEYCYCADANFGLFARDMEIVEYVIKLKKETGFPQKFQATYSKTNAETVFEINKLLNEAGLSKGATLSFQSMSHEVLEKINRKNMPLESFISLMSMYNKDKIPAYSELILGLPGESYESFTDGIEQLLECGQHMSINIYNCEMLANSIMNNPDYINEHKLVSAKTEQLQYHIIPCENDVTEYSNIIVATDTMPKQMWFESNIFGVFVRSLHNLGLLQCAAIYLFHEKNIKYKDFYCDIIRFAKENPQSLCGKIYSWLLNKYTEISESRGSMTSSDKAFGPLIWPLEEFVFLKFVESYEMFYEEIIPVIKKYFLDEDLFSDILKYQKEVVKTPYSTGAVLELEYDWYDYFSNIYNNTYKPLKKVKNTVEIDNSEVPQNLPEYAKNTIWFGRRGGQNISSKISYKK